MIDERLLAELRIVAQTRRHHPSDSWNGCADFIASEFIKRSIHHPPDWEFYEKFYRDEVEKR